uniref:DUF6314 domain-containing protein n=1 Tax=Mucochytrium quahogii TaxID=96639 RepID=A0A7S2SDL0_9STRA|mmetsp:Transcript_6908/g.10928  ORF Transcript_6908/g.10928 Transcript_6908/m.10928 type:complete len:174 (+) Transcript_6908:412-933(+)
MMVCLFDVLRGRWSLRRRIVGADGSLMGTVVDGAKAVFGVVGDGVDWNVVAGRTPTGAFDVGDVKGLLYRESGDVELGNGQHLSFHREYLYRFVSDEAADVYFFKPGIEEEHLKYFHRVSLDESGCSNAEHLCIDDLYTVHMSFENSNAFKMHWKIKGPQKDYEIFSSFTKEE